MLAQPLRGSMKPAGQSQRAWWQRIRAWLGNGAQGGERFERQIQFALDQHAIVSTTDVDGVITYVNDRFCDISGYERHELIGQTHRVVKSDEHTSEFYRIMWTTIRSGQTWHGEVRNRRKDGEHYWVAATIVPILDATGHIHQFVWVGTDITGQKALEREIEQQRAFLVTLTDTLGEGVIVQDADGLCMYMNREAERLLGWNRADFLGRQVHNTIHMQDAQGKVLSFADCPVRRALATGTGYRSRNEVFRRRDGSIFPVMLTARPLFDGDKETGGVLAFTDISEEKRQIDELEFAREAAEAAARTKSMFLATMSHEIRTPMNAVLGLAYLGIAQSEQGTQREQFRKIHAAGTSLLGIINEILDFSKIEAGKLVIEPIDFNLKQALLNVIWLVEQKAALKGLQIELIFPPGLAVLRHGDGRRLAQVLTNLLDNAVKFTDHGGVVLAIAEAGKRDGIDQLEFRVRDSGIGMNASEIERLFEPFEQADGSSTRRHGGTGLGLTICRRLVEMMSGDLKVSSTLGKGTEFMVTLPLAAVTAGRSTAHRIGPAALVAEVDDRDDPLATALRVGRQFASAQSADPLMTIAEPLRGLRVLLVEDNPVNREVAVAVLEHYGLQVDIATTGLEAIELFERHHPVPWSAVLMDVHMPELDGISATARLREDARFAHVPIIAMTADALAEERQRCLAAGMSDHLAKPFLPEDLMGLLLRWCRRVE